MPEVADPQSPDGVRARALLEHDRYLGGSDAELKALFKSKIG